MKKNKLKYWLAILFIIIFTFSIVPKTFQNDTFYIIELGRGILKHGVDWQDHYSIHSHLEYRYPHWAFDVMGALVYNAFGFTGIYVTTQILASIFLLIVFWNMIRKEIHFNLAFLSTLLVAYMMKGSFYARGQVISFSIFLLEFMILENFAERPTFFKSLALFGLSVIMANVHSTAWIMMLILVLPFIGEQVFYWYSLKGINERLLKRYQKKYQKLKEKGASEEKLKIWEEKIQQQKDFKIRNEEQESVTEHKIIVKKKPNEKYMWVAILVLIMGAFITPLKLTPFFYFIKISIGNSMSYINEHLPVILAGNLELFCYTTILIALIGFTNTKLKLSDAFLILGLYLMAISSRRNVFLLIGLTSGIVVKMIDDFIKKNMPTEAPKARKVFGVVIGIASVLFSIYMFIGKIEVPYVSPKLYPVDAAKYIKENLDYQNVRFYNQYDYGSYLLMEKIPVFLDSRCDLYTPEFNKNVKVFDDYMDVQYGKNSISSLMDQYQLEYALVPVTSFERAYMREDKQYTKIYEDKYFVIYQYEKEESR